MRSFIEDTLSRKIIFFTGKGGVGKSTLTWATALLCQREGRRVLVASWNPLEKAPQPSTPNEPGIATLFLDTLTCFREYVLTHIKFERIYDVVFENHVLKTFIQTAPGISDTVIAGKLYNLVQTEEYDHVLVDLPSSGHALSFFQSPLGIKKIFSVGGVHKDATAICDLFQGPNARLDFVSIPEELSVTENLELKTKLSQTFPMAFGFLHMNQLVPTFQLPEPNELPESLRECRRYYVERKTNDEQALEASAAFRLTRVDIPRVISETAHEVVQHVARCLEGA